MAESASTKGRKSKGGGKGHARPGRQRPLKPPCALPPAPSQPDLRGELAPSSP